MMQHIVFWRVLFVSQQSVQASRSACHLSGNLLKIKFFFAQTGFFSTRLLIFPLVFIANLPCLRTIYNDLHPATDLFHPFAFSWPTAWPA